MKVNQAIPYFHPAEIGILNQLLDIATDFWKIEDFIKNHVNSVFVPGEEKKKLHGMYVQALCSGLEEVLEPYRQTLIDLENSILKNKTAQLSFIQHKIFPYQPVMRNICGLLQQLEFRKAHGCYILDFIYKASCSGNERIISMLLLVVYENVIDKFIRIKMFFAGVANVREAMTRLLHEGHKVLYKQLLRWILQGNLYDPFEEFFVKSIEKSPEDPTKKDAIAISEDEDQIDKQLASKFQLRIEMIPCHISISTAEKIFFIGESIQLFERDRNMDARGGNNHLERILK